MATLTFRACSPPLHDPVALPFALPLPLSCPMSRAHPAGTHESGTSWDAVPPESVRESPELADRVRVPRWVAVASLGAVPDRARFPPRHCVLDPKLLAQARVRVGRVPQPGGPCPGL